MAGNSANCKTWCITLLAGLVALAFGQTRESVLAIGLVVTFLFYVLDSYYLALEKGFRDEYDKAVRTIRENKPIAELFQVTPSAKWGWALRSPSTFLVYLALLGALGGAYVLMRW
jgi:hypothetical protein